MRIKILIIPTAFMLIFALTAVSWTDIQKKADFPEEVSAILENSCYTCHTTGSRAEDAIEKLDFKKWEDLRKTKKVGILNDIHDVINKDMMPPERYLKKNPEKAMSEEEKQKIKKWAKKEMANLMGGDEKN